MVEDFTARLGTIDIEAVVRMCARDRHGADLDGDVTGMLTDDARERVASMTVLGGRTQPASSPDSLAKPLVIDRGHGEPAA